MDIKFHKIILHNFLSFGDSEVDLSNRGYCKVKGINNCKKDSALSNGSGKSSIWSGISYALTGETIQGLKSNIVNIYGTDGCFVKLFFSVDSDEYEITRYKDYAKIGTDLKIIINGEDKSGKGIRESQSLLGQYLPDVTTGLLGSVIILGQGLPHKFSNNSPSGRKEVLERLSKSDFMIQDLKNRIESRSTKLNSDKRSIDDSLLSLSSQASIYTKELVKANEELQQTSEMPNFDALILEHQTELINLNNKKQELKIKIKSLEEQATAFNEQLLKTTSIKSDRLNTLNKEFENLTTPLKDKLTEVNQQVYALGLDISKLKSITDVCPTCHQKIPGTVKPDTTEKEKTLEQLKHQARELTETLSKYKEDKELKTVTITTEDDTAITELKRELALVKSELLTLKSSGGEEKLSSSILQRSNAITALENNKNNFLANKTKLQNRVVELSETIDSINASVEAENKKRELVQQHLDVVTKMNTLVKRDFRGFLLSSVIEFINRKAKEYSQDIFGTSELDFVLNGNDIDISYSGKAFENLSGGEKQRVDLILQFAIRDMMSQYLSFTSNILVLDEIFDGLDILGTTNVLNLISKKLTDVESIFIISHNDSLEIPYDDMLVVVKNEEGISEVK